MKNQNGLALIPALLIIGVLLGGIGIGLEVYKQRNLVNDAANEYFPL